MKNKTKKTNSVHLNVRVTQDTWEALEKKKKKLSFETIAQVIRKIFNDSLNITSDNEENAEEKTNEEL